MSKALASVPFRTCVYLACAPDEVLTTADVAIKFNCNIDNVSMMLRTAVKLGYLASSRPYSGRGGGMNEYRAGPLLLRMLGRTA